MIEVLKQALDALETPKPLDDYPPILNAYAKTINNAIASLQQAIKDLESQEPVAWIAPRYEGGHENLEVVDEREFGAFRVYTHPPQRTWQGLTDEEREKHRDDWHSNIHDKEFKAIEAKLKEKNND